MRRRHTTIAALMLLALLAPAGSATATPGSWDDPQVVDTTTHHRLVAGVANAGGVFALWRRGGKRTWVSHRDPGPRAAWSTPRVLRGPTSLFREDGPVVAIPGDGGALRFESNRPAERTIIWRISAEGVPSGRQVLPFNTFVPTEVDVRHGRWLVAGTSQAVPGIVRAAVRRADGTWRATRPLPTPRNGELLGAWFDREGVAHVVAAQAVADSRPAAARGGRPVYEAMLRPDGSWTTPRRIAATRGRGSLSVNADGDTALRTTEAVEGVLRTAIRVRPFGGSWSPPVRFPELASAMAVDDAGRVAVVRAGDDVTFGRISALGAVTWQQLTDETFTNNYPDAGRLAQDGSGVTMVPVLGTRTGPEGTSTVLRTFRCVPGGPCGQVGDFPYSDLPSFAAPAGPAGTTYLLSDALTAACDTPGLCAWRLPSP